MHFNFTTNIVFNKDSHISPDIYYLDECATILEELCKYKKYNLIIIDGGGNSEQECGNLWIAYEYIESEIKKEIILSVTHEALNIDIEINFKNNCENEDDILLCEFINILKNNFINIIKL